MSRQAEIFLQYLYLPEFLLISEYEILQCQPDLLDKDERLALEAMLALAED